MKGFIAISQFEDNGYKNVIVSIHPDVPEENGSIIIKNIKVCACKYRHSSFNTDLL